MPSSSDKMTHKRLILTARMLGWFPIAGGFIHPPPSKPNHDVFMIVSENEFIISSEQSYRTAQEVYDYITMENPDDAKERNKMGTDSKGPWNGPE